MFRAEGIRFAVPLKLFRVPRALANQLLDEGTHPDQQLGRRRGHATHTQTTTAQNSSHAERANAA